MSYSYRDLIAWQRAKDLSVIVYRSTKDFPREEGYGLVSQMRRAAVSIPSNIAEGQGRATAGEFRQFLGHARGSLLELETQIIISSELCLLSNETNRSLLSKCGELKKIINGLIDSLSTERLPKSAHSKLETRNQKLQL